MKTTIIILLSVLSFTLVAQDRQMPRSDFSILTNDSIRYWEEYCSFRGHYWFGFSFSADSTWVAYSVDARGRRVRNVFGRIENLGENLKFSINNDTLLLTYTYKAGYGDYDFVYDTPIIIRMYKLSIVDMCRISLTLIEFSYIYNVTRHPDLIGFYYKHINIEEPITILGTSGDARQFDAVPDQTTRPELERRMRLLDDSWFEVYSSEW